MRASRLAARLLDWYRRERRNLPWRECPTPYGVWISEVMLQQTRVEAVIPYFERWMARFPTLRDLAQADEQDVLKAWEGLGYYARPRHLQRAARLVLQEYAGQLPNSVEALQRLPGVGPYTAAAIASMAFGLDVAAVDGNVRRVLARLFNIDQSLDTRAGRQIVQQLAVAHLPRGRAGEYNQALMDLGASLCLPGKPRCTCCPLMAMCEAYRLGVQEQRPVRAPRKETPGYQSVAVVVERPIGNASHVLLARRPSEGLLGGLWEFPNGRVEGEPALGVREALRGAYRLRVRSEAFLGVVRHAYSHFRVTVHVFRARLLSRSLPEPLSWVEKTRLEDYPMGGIARQIARKWL